MYGQKLKYKFKNCFQNMHKKLETHFPFTFQSHVLV